MALTTETRTFNSKDYDFYVTEDNTGTGGGIFGIYQGGLFTVDETALSDADTNGTGANLKEKLTGYKLVTNGQDGFETYGDQIVNIDTFMQSIETRTYGSSIAPTLYDHEQRITAVEP